MAEVRDKNIDSIIDLLKERPCSINEIAAKLEINWRTAESYLELLKGLHLVDEKPISNTRTFFFKDKNNYFELPVKPKDEKRIKTIYALITHFSKKLNKEPTKTQVYKIIWKVDKQLTLKLPIGWYRYGPCCEIVYKGTEDKLMDLSEKEVRLIKETTESYITIDNFDLQKKIYKEEDKALYLAKESLLGYTGNDKDKLDEILMQLVKFVPNDAVDVATDFARLVLLKGWDRKTRECFTFLWKYVTMLNLKESLSFYYDYLDIYLDEKIADSKKEIQLLILSMLQPK